MRIDSQNDEIWKTSKYAYKQYFFNGLCTGLVPFCKLVAYNNKITTRRINLSVSVQAKAIKEHDSVKKLLMKQFTPVDLWFYHEHTTARLFGPS